MNVQYAIKDDEIYVIEVNPRASRTVPFVSKAHGIPWAKIAAKVMVGKTLAELGIAEPAPPKHVSVKEVVFPFSKFPGVDVILGPEMRSTGEVMGIDKNFPLAFAKSADRRRHGAADQGHGLHLRAQCRQGSDRADRASICRRRIRTHHHRRHVRRARAKPASKPGGSTSSPKAGPTSPT